jgi:hypothetical protein
MRVLEDKAIMACAGFRRQCVMWPERGHVQGSGASGSRRTRPGKTGRGRTGGGTFRWSGPVSNVNQDRVWPHLPPSPLKVCGKAEAKPPGQVSPPLWREVHERLRRQTRNGRGRSSTP